MKGHETVDDKASCERRIPMFYCKTRVKSWLV